MNRAVLASAAAALIAAAGIGFVAVAQRQSAPAIAMVTRAAAEEGRAPIYFQDPDGKPSYSLTSRKTLDGRRDRSMSHICSPWMRERAQGYPVTIRSARLYAEDIR